MDRLVEEPFPSQAQKRKKMKDCCKTGNGIEQKNVGFKKWFKIILYIILVIILVGALISQISATIEMLEWTIF